MKKIVFVSAALLLSFFFGASVYAQEQVKVECVSLEMDENGYCDVCVNIVNGVDIALIQFTLRYDPSKITCMGGEAGELLSGGEPPLINAEIAGEISLVWDTLSPISGDGTLLRLHMWTPVNAAAELTFDRAREFIVAHGDLSSADAVGVGCVLGASDAAASKWELPPTFFATAALLLFPPVGIIVLAAKRRKRLKA